MTVVSVQPRPTKTTTATKTAEGTKYTAVYLVTTDSSADDAQVVADADGLPALNSPYAFGNGADDNSFLSSIEPKQLGHTQKWEVTCTYEPSTSVGPPVTNVMLEEPTIEVGYQQYTRGVESAEFMFLVQGQNLGGVAALNRRTLGPLQRPIAKAGDIVKPQSSSGEPFSPPLEKDDSRLLVRITRNETSLSTLLTYKDAINVDFFTIRRTGFLLAVPKRCAKFQSIQASQKTVVIPRASIQGTAFPGMETLGRQFVRVVYWRVSYELSVNQDTWDPQVGDVGFREAVLSGDDDGAQSTINQTEIHPQQPRIPGSLEIRDPRGGYFAHPQPLDGHGKLNLTTEGADPNNPAFATPVYSQWRTYPLLPFRALNL